MQSKEIAMTFDPRKMAATDREIKIAPEDIITERITSFFLYAFR
jgi:hypothetical protein